ncbi:MAG: hypothetical protein ACREDX_00315 [Aestuariivirga sp.]
MERLRDVLRLQKLLITVPILFLPLGAAAVKPALASEIAAEQAVQILTRARVADTLCIFLSTSLHEELSRYAARAEIAAAHQTSVDTARNAIAAGEAEGQAAPCSEATRTDVGDTLSAARDAVKAADSGRGIKQMALREARRDPQAGVGGLGYYATAVNAYYAERKCRHLSAKQDMRYWKAIGRLHRRTVAQNGAAAVAPVMRGAERSANAQSCGNNTRMIVQAGFAATIEQ